MLTENNEVITIGSNMKHVLGTSVANANCNVLELKKLEGFKTGERVIKVKANERSCCILTSLGKVYYWGQGSEKGEIFKTPTLIKSNEKMVEISLGYRHIIAMNEEGIIYSAGSNTKLQLGYETKKQNFKIKFRKVKNVPNARLISSGIYFSCALTSDGNIYYWGKNNLNDENVPVTLLPINHLKNVFISQIFCGPESIFAISDRKNLPAICYSLFYPPTMYLSFFILFYHFISFFYFSIFLKIFFSI
jgi:alpha-tubulin suppressor-like RCC1 family protein